MGAKIIRAVAAQASRVGFIDLDIDMERGGAAAEELERQKAHRESL